MLVIEDQEKIENISLSGTIIYKLCLIGQVQISNSYITNPVQFPITSVNDAVSHSFKHKFVLQIPVWTFWFEYHDLTDVKSPGHFLGKHRV